MWVVVAILAGEIAKEIEKELSRSSSFAGV